MTNNSTTIDGWDFLFSGNWVEPKNWKGTIRLKNAWQLQCLEKIEIGTLKIFTLGIIYTDLVIPIDENESQNILTFYFQGNMTEFELG